MTNENSKSIRRCISIIWKRNESSRVDPKDSPKSYKKLTNVNEDIALVELKKMQLELDRCLASVNPLDWLKAMRLEKRVHLAIEMCKGAAEMRKEEAEMRKEAAEVRKEEAAAERKLIHVSFVDSDNVVYDADTTISLSRHLFKNWEENEKLLHRVGETTNTNKFEDVEEGGSYYLSKRILNTNYDGYAKAEADRQAQD